MGIELQVSNVNGYVCPADPGEPGSGAPRMSVNDEEGRILMELVRGRSVLEIGTGLGVSTRHLARSARWVVTFDVDKWVAENVAPGLPENVQFVGEASLLGPVECAFIDGLHTYEQCGKDIQLARALVEPGGIIIFHDFYIEGVQRAILDTDMPVVHVQSTAGMAIAWNERGEL